MAKRERSDPGFVSWVDLATPDLRVAKKFYGELLGWKYTGGEDPNNHYYTTAEIGGRRVAAMWHASAENQAPPAWTVYIETADADATAKKATDAGGGIVAPAMNVMEHGRMALLTDPTGALFGVWQSKTHTGAQLVDEPGAMTWHEVYTRDVAKARDFYANVFGLEPKHLDAPGVDYWTMQRGDRIAFGAMQMTSQFPPEVPSHWNSYFAATDVDASTKKAAALGGKEVAPPFDTPYGRMSVLADPAGASFCLITPPKGR